MSTAPLRVFGILTLVSAFTTPLPAQPTPPYSLQEIAAHVSPSTVAVLGTSGFGSGVVVSDRGHIVTNFHVVDGQDQLAVQFPGDNAYYEATRVADDTAHDLALLHIDAPNLIPATLGDANRVNQAETVVVIGNPQGLAHTVSNGILTGFETVGEGAFTFSRFPDNALATGTRLFQTNAAVSGGNSGGGMFNDRAELIGIVSFIFIEGQNLNFAIPVNYVSALLGNPLPLTTAPTTNVTPAATDTSSPSAQVEATRSWRSLLVLLPILVLLIAWFIRQQQEGA